MKTFLSIVIILTVMMSLVACSSERYGLGVDKNIPLMKVKDIVLDSTISGKKVTVSGNISSQCMSSGCWFVLRDDTGQVFINLAPNNMIVPPRMERPAKVTGTVITRPGELQIVADGVEVR